MSIYEYDEERQRQFDKEEGRELGREAKLSEVVEEITRKERVDSFAGEMSIEEKCSTMAMTKIGQALVNHGIEKVKTEQISKKLAKGKSIPEIADALEETEEYIKELIQKHNL